MTQQLPRADESWSRPQLTIRLTARRKELLERLASREGVAGGPGDAIDRAIELALREPKDDDGERVAGLEERMDAFEAAQRADADAARSALALVAQELANLRALLAALAEES